MVLLMTVALAISVDEVPNPRPDGRWVSDVAAVIDGGAEAELETLLQALQRDTGAEVVMVTLPTVKPDTPKAFATGLFNHWGVGDRAANNGVLVLLVMDERRLEMETGYGVESVLTDGWLGGMQRQTMVPLFKQGDFGGGVVAGIGQIDKKLRGDVTAVREGTRGKVDVKGQADDGVSVTTVAAVGGAGVAGTLGMVGVGGLVMRKRRRERTCPDCEVWMPMLDEAEDDAHLEEGQQMEEAIGSVDWQVHQCPQCEFIRTFRKGKWFSGFSHCTSCGNQTRSSRTTTLRAATTYSGGLVEVFEQCAHCDFENHYTRSTPRIRVSSSSSSGGSFGGGSGGGGGGGGGSFGGGSSGGGGAGSSW